MLSAKDHARDSFLSPLPTVGGGWRRGVGEVTRSPCSKITTPTPPLPPRRGREQDGLSCHLQEESAEVASPYQSPEDSVLEYANLGNFLVQIPLGHHWPLTPFDTICDIRFFRQRKFSPLFVKMAAINAETKITIIS
jgi:hypothetical protein